MYSINNAQNQRSVIKIEIQVILYFISLQIIILTTSMCLSYSNLYS